MIVKKIILFVFLFCLYSCIRRVETPQWKSNLLAPLATAELSLEKMIFSDSLLQVSQDSGVSLVDEIELSTISFDNLIKFKAIPFKETYNLQSLQLGSNSTTRRFSLGELIAGNPLSGFFVDGQILPSIITNSLPPTLELGPLGPLAYDASNLLESATLLTGNLSVSIENELPLSIQNASVVFRNAIDKSVIIKKDNISIPYSGTYTFTEDLAGKTVKSNMEIIITTLQASTDKLKTVVIDTSKALVVSLNLSNVTVSEATAIFPSQNVIDEKSNVVFEDMGKYQIKNAKLKSGKVRIEVESTAQDTLYFDYIIPSITENGLPFSTKEKVNPATSTQASKYYKEFDFTNWDLDLSLKSLGKDTVNTFRSELTGRINYTGKLIYLSLKDSLSINLTMLDLVAEEAEGYLGDTSFSFKGEQYLSNIGKFQNAKIKLKDAKISLQINNGLGVPAALNIEKLDVENTNLGIKESLVGEIVFNSQSILAAQNKPFAPITNLVNINSVNSNINDVLSIIPNKVSYMVDFNINPDGKVVYTNFLNKESFINAKVLIETPLLMNIENWILMDTTTFALDSVQNLELIEGGFLNCILYNGFPLQIRPTFYFLDNSKNPIDTLYTTDQSIAAQVDNKGKAIDSPRSVLKFSVSHNTLQNLKNAKYLATKIEIATKPNDFVRLYSNYKAKIHIAGDFIYQNKKY